jgi:two-component system response regulator (stage 0 sporulation protein F)
LNGGGSGPTTAGRKILIVDDEPTILLALSRLLERERNTVITAERTEDARKALLEHSFDLVIADVRLGGMRGREGLELLSFVKESSPQTTVIIMTAFGSDEIREDAYRRGASHYYEKPIDLGQLLAKMETLGIPPQPATYGGS